MASLEHDDPFQPCLVYLNNFLSPLFHHRATMVIRIGEEKQEEYTHVFTWFSSVPPSMGIAA